MTNINEEKLTSREWELYDLLKEHADGLTLKEICDLLPQHFTYQETAINPCRELYRAIEFINLSLEIDKIIVKAKGGKFKFATKEESEDFIDDMKNKAMTYLMRRSIAITKIRQDGQGKILSNKGLPIDGKSKAKPFHEAFIEYFETESFEDFMSIPPFTPVKPLTEVEEIVASVEEVEITEKVETTPVESEIVEVKENILEVPKSRPNTLESVKKWVLTDKGDIINSELATIKEVNGVFYVKYTAFRERSNGSYFAEDVKGVVVATSDSRVDLGGEEER